jgi:hypothetical protein
MALQLVVTAGPDRGRAFDLPPGQPVLLGRGRQTHTHLTDLQVSRVHCQVERTPSEILVTDLNSAGGTFVNGEAVTRRRLQPGDVLRIGETELRLEAGDVAEEPTIVPEAPGPRAAAPPRGRPAAPPRPASAAPPPPALRTASPAPRPEPPPPPPAPVLTGPRLAELSGTTLGPFAVGPVLAKGQAGMVFRATNQRDGQTVALKVLWPEFSRNETEVRRFIRSMKTILPLHHPNLITLLGAGKKGPYCWLAMEYVEGESLTDFLRARGAAGMLDWRHAFRVGLYLAQGLEYAHARRVVHRNITPRNVMLRKKDGLAKLGDLMLAKALEGGLAEPLTRSGELLGDVRFMSPERTRGEEVDERADLYSLGALLYTLLTGRPPFEGLSLVETVTAIRNKPPELPRKFQLSIPERFQDVVLNLLAKRPEGRYPSAKALLAELDKIAKFLDIRV